MGFPLEGEKPRFPLNKRAGDGPEGIEEDGEEEEEDGDVAAGVTTANPSLGLMNGCFPFLRRPSRESPPSAHGDSSHRRLVRGHSEGPGAGSVPATAAAARPPPVPKPIDISGLSLQFAGPERREKRPLSFVESLGPPEGTVVYTVQKGDTLSGIAIAHGCKVEAIRRLNKLPLSSNLPITDSLIVPVEPGRPVRLPVRDEEKDKKNRVRALAARFVGMAGEVAGGVTEDEAVVYIELAGGSLEAAIEAWKRDVEWERSGKGGKPEPSPIEAPLLPTQPQVVHDLIEF